MLKRKAPTSPYKFVCTGCMNPCVLQLRIGGRPSDGLAPKRCPYSLKGEVKWERCTK